MDSEMAESDQLKSRYGVFISFRGPDTRQNFTGYLYNCLVDAGIHTFMDSEELGPGQQISRELLRAIRGSRISVVVFSKNYAYSRWCLDELAEIVECRKTAGQMIFPVFYDVFPSDVRKQSGSFKQAFVQHEKKLMPPEHLQRWRLALNSHQGILVREIVRRVSLVLKDELHLHVATFPVGLDSRVHKVSSFLSSGSDSVHFVGILGMGGIGKTTLAKALYNQLVNQFDGVSFVADVRINSQQPMGLIALQKQLLNDIGIKSNETTPLGSADQGKTIIKNRLCSRRVLIILDDVSEEHQVQALAGGRDWFGSGSRVVLTTRNQKLLKNVKVDYVCKAEALNNAESLQLFSSHAFEKGSPEEEFVQFSKQIVGYCKGVPLALEVLGRSLFETYNVVEWEGTIEKLKIIPPDGIQEKLRISYDAIGGNDKLKGLFLDIACFFVGCNKNHAIEILEACGLFAKVGISELCNRCLVEVDERNRLKMHDLLRDMGREIVREESPRDPGKRSRLWYYEDVKSTLRSHLGTKEVEGIVLTLSNELCVSAKAFQDMKRLRVVQFNNLRVDGKYELMSKELRWLFWHKFSLTSIPDDLYMGEVVAIDLQHSHLRKLYSNNQKLENLKFLNLSHSQSLTGTPDFANFPNLEELILEGCVKLKDVHQSIGQARKLVLANFKDYKKLKKIPDSISNVKSLKIFNISGCSSIDKVPENLEQMESLTEFLADGTAITHVPLSNECFKNLAHLSLSGCNISFTLPDSSWISGKQNSISCCSIFLAWFWTELRHCLPGPSLCELSSIKVLNLMDCSLSNVQTVNSIGRLKHLEELDLRKNKFHSLPDSFGDLAKLRTLLVDDCENLNKLPDMPANLVTLSATNCTSLNMMSMSKFQPGTKLLLSNCHQLAKIGGLDKREPGGSIYLEQCNNLATEFKNFLMKDWCGRGDGNIFLPGSEIPEWFDCQDEGSSLVCTVPSIGGRRPKAFTVCVIYTAYRNNKDSRPFPIIQLEPLNIDRSIGIYLMNIAVTWDDHMWIFHMADSVVGDQLDWVKEMKLSVQFGIAWNVKRVGVYFSRDI